MADALTLRQRFPKLAQRACVFGGKLSGQIVIASENGGAKVP